MNDSVTGTEFVVEDVGVLQQGRVVLVGVKRGQSIKPGMHAVHVTAAGALSIEVVSIGIVDPPPENPDRQLLQVRVAGGDARSLKAQILELK